ncbi:lytic transglycosylase domain-containing protein [Aestuariirhabdus litorea]|uniref:Lytic transglycosylase domain-containing protein n=1 Tax=Aestuariirhabdus litorea TaxID=2528527 RepID=A0A3P3VN23_9GAMM|nr:lytic transglycosylase domain-containing protein [Aestuariirhabdus litorea]RRJ84162.1 lytic transglycosylase domain-containing protein [Aestuariirhabdus litorea]RWW97382.1 lytic transglycosylase domain-containing protein [Endozoicomonadaceae bacterium GTF-13]
MNRIPPLTAWRQHPLKVGLLLLMLVSPLPPALAEEGVAVDQALRSLLADTVNSADSFEDRFDAQVWLLDMSSRLERLIPDHNRRLDLLRQVHREATRAKLQPELVIALIQVESGFNRYAVSSAGAQGLMQVMPFWKNEIGRPEDNLTDIATNLRYGCTILAYYLEKEKGNLIRGLARYNGSLGKTWYPERVMTAWYDHWYVHES